MTLKHACLRELNTCNFQIGKRMLDQTALLMGADKHRDIARCERFASDAYQAVLSISNQSGNFSRTGLCALQLGSRFWD